MKDIIAAAKTGNSKELVRLLGILIAGNPNVWVGELIACKDSLDDSTGAFLMKHLSIESGPNGESLVSAREPPQ